MANSNLRNLATELTEIVGQTITEEHIHPSANGREYYIQAPKQGAPMLLHHYRGPFFVDMHPDDLEELTSDKVSAHDYIRTANWQVGYYWGGGSMIGGGYYQPLDIISRKEEVRRYLQILSCRGYRRACGYMPTEGECLDCTLKSCPFSKYKEGDWDMETIHEPDPRVALFKTLNKRFKQEHQGYTLDGGICCSEQVHKGEIWLDPTGRYTNQRFFKAYVESALIRDLLMREVTTENLEEFSFKIFTSHRWISNEVVEATSENVEKAFEERQVAKKIPLMARVKNFFMKF